jgi:hypothetical protein
MLSTKKDVIKLLTGVAICIILYNKHNNRYRRTIGTLPDWYDMRNDGPPAQITHGL